MRNTILVTGGAGYIGSHTCKILAAANFNPVVYDNLSTGHSKFVKWGELIIGDILDQDRLIKVLAQYQPTAIIHFAASAYVGESMTNPLKYYQNNVATSIALLSAMEAAKIPHLIFSSSCATYGIPESNLIGENCQQKPINPYGKSKLMVEQILHDVSKNKKIQHVNLRYFNAAGADADLEIGELHEPETHLIPLAIEAARKGKLMQIFGGDFNTRDGTAIRDFTHVSDIGIAHLCALKYLLNGNQSDSFNLGTGVGTSVLEVIQALNSLGLFVQYEIKKRRDGDPPTLVADPQKANNLLGWRPLYRDIRQILQTAIDWHAR